MNKKFKEWYLKNGGSLNILDPESVAEAGWNAARLEPTTTSEEIASWLNVSRRHFIERISKTKGFPLPVMPSVWTVKDINNWINRNKGATR